MIEGVVLVFIFLSYQTVTSISLLFALITFSVSNTYRLIEAEATAVCVFTVNVAEAIPISVFPAISCAPEASLIVAETLFTISSVKS